MKNLIFVLATFILGLTVNPVHAQWEQVNNGLTNPNVYSMAVSGTMLFAGTMGGGVFRSTDNGDSWIAVNTGLSNLLIQSLAVSGVNLFAGTYAGVFRSTNNGLSWTLASSGMSYVQDIAVYGTNIIAGTSFGGVFISTDTCATWSAANNGLTNLYVVSFYVSGTNIFAGTFDGVFLSTDTCASWVAVSNGIPYTQGNRIITAITSIGTNLFAGNSDGGGVYRSNDNGTSWTTVNNNLQCKHVGSFATYGTNIFAGTDTYCGVFRSNDNGANWLPTCGSGLGNAGVTALIISEPYIFAGTYGPGVWRGSVTQMTATEENSDNTLLMLYPNPSNGKFSLEFSRDSQRETVSVDIYGIRGEKILTETLNGERKHEFSLSDRPTGVYFIRVISGDKAETVKIVKQ